MADEMQRRDQQRQQQRCEQCRQRASSMSTSTAVDSSAPITLVVYPTTGGHFELAVNRTGTVDSLKRAISKKLKVAKERLCLLHKDRQLQDGTLLDNNIQEGNKITLLPIVETGLLAQRPDQCVLQALENLNDSQINDFLSGKAPLNLTMRLGDHMMFIQLQLSTASSTVTPDVTPRGGKEAPSAQVSTSTAAATTSSSSSSTRPSSGSSSSGLIRMPTVANIAATSAEESTTIIGGRPTTRELPLKDADSRHHHSHLLERDTLAQASRSLSNTLKHLSTSDHQSSTTTNRVDVARPECVEHRQVQPACSANNRGRAGAIIESMHHHGKGVYSGTFSGTLNPALQDRNGHPKRDISTIVHILNDLLGASPQYRRHQHSNRQTPVDAVAVSLARGSSSGGVRRRSDRIIPSKCEEEFSRLSQENMATRGKMEQLRMMMEERRSHRRARRENRLSPYGRSPWTPMGVIGRKSSAAAAVMSTVQSAPMEIVVDGQRLTDGGQDPSSPSCGADLPTTSPAQTEPSSPSPDNAMDCTATNASEEYLTTPNPVVA